MNKIIVVSLIVGLFAFESVLPCAHEGRMCAGIAGIKCCEGEGIKCFAADKNMADWAGKCVRSGCRELGESCGGIAGLACCDPGTPLGSGLHCRITEHHPDAMGKCVRG